ncbi:checkpoint protein HUS1-like [Ylistrum balloti]|uniref:checkpoint protein HUS1-like n=1 Tax=Ylistrum balloti TaxID=509963 RepID=UPI002905AF41|nr:checkpoint protein HUS1-like [Ylistrum balloti]
MRFRGKIVDIGCIQHFTRIVGTLSKLIRTCVLRITSGNWYFILSERAVNGGIQIWSELPQGHFFDEYAMEGVSEEDNEIFLELAPENLMKALKTAQSAKWLKIKLTKKHTPCLTVEVDLPTLSAHSRTVVHDIPVTVIPRRLWTDFEEPELPHFDVSIVSDKSGTDPMMNPSQDDRDPHTFFKTRIDIRKLSQLLASQQFNPTRVICNVVNNRTVHFLLLQDGVSLQYFMPVIAS